MPLYDFECEPCAYYTEIRQGPEDPDVHLCPHCMNTTLRKVFINAPSISVVGEANTIGQLMDRNTKKMGKYEMQDKNRKNNINHSIDTGKPKCPRSDWPHHATITFKIDVRKMNNDGSLDHKVLGNEILKKYGVSNKAQICVSGATEADCIKNLIEMLEKMNG
jgi:putative FmdB family regulatory protein